jgi:hypothetical protein
VKLVRKASPDQQDLKVSLDQQVKLAKLVRQVRKEFKA